MVDIDIDWGDVRDGNTETITQILKPLIEQGFDSVKGWAVLNLDTCINVIGIDMYRGKDKLKVKLYSPSMVITPKGDVVDTPENFWCTTNSRMELLQDKCETYGIEAKLDCPILDDELFVEVDGRYGSAKSSSSPILWGREE